VRSFIMVILWVQRGGKTMGRMGSSDPALVGL
jgi:hypothetical protein